MIRFNGSDYSPPHDDIRLTKQHDRIKNLMSDKVWRTLSEIEALVGDPQASISAQLRHLRKQRFGGWVVQKRNRGERESGLFEYRILHRGDESVSREDIENHNEFLIEKRGPNTSWYILFPTGAYDEKPKLFKTKTEAIAYKFKGSFSGVIHEVEEIK